MIITLLILILVLCGIGSLVQIDSFKYYKLTYDSLVNGTVMFDYSYGGLYYFCEPSNKDQYGSEIVIFTNTEGKFRDVKVGPWEYIHGGLLSWMSPYSLYWWFKYRDWFEKNKKSFDTLK